jgi:hypothetical protein
MILRVADDQSSILFMNQNVTYSHPVDAASLPAGFENARVWRATINAPGAEITPSFCLFQPGRQAGDAARDLEAAWPGWQASGPECVERQAASRNRRK